VQLQHRLAPEVFVNEFVLYLLQNAYIDFDGGIGVEDVRKMLRDDDSQESRILLSKLIEDKGLEDLMVTVADCLKEHLRTGINEDVIRNQLLVYSDS
jgi:hypothetical protein